VFDTRVPTIEKKAITGPAAALHRVDKILPAETDMHDRLSNYGRALLKFILEGLTGVGRINESANTLHDLDRGQLFYTIGCLDVIERELLAVDFDAHVVVWKPARRCVEYILVGFECRSNHPEERQEEKQANDVDRCMTE
jgi:hypothetical protein